MRKYKMSWNDKIRLALHELEGKVQRDANAGNSGVWPDPEEVKAWSAQRHKDGGRESEGIRYGEQWHKTRLNETQPIREPEYRGQYCGGSVHTGGQTKEDVKRKNFVQTVMLQVAKSAAFALATVALLQGVGRMLPDSITVSNTVNGRELPIYCVQTDEKKVALSFDAAWGNEDTQKILDILKKHNVKVTFFMTGGWVDK